MTNNDTRVGIREISYGEDVHRRIGTAVAVGVFTLGVGALIALSKSKKHPNCHPEAAESHAQASDSQRRISALPADHAGMLRADNDLLRKDKKGGLALQCDKNDYRGILAGPEGVSGKKAVDSETMTVKN